MLTVDLNRYKDSDLTVLELYEIVAKQEQEILDNKQKERDSLTEYYDSFIGKYIRVKFNSTAYGFLFIEFNIFQKYKFVNRCIYFYKNSISIEPKFCNYLWLKPELKGKDWEFISEEDFLGYEKQVKDLIKLVIK